MIVRRACGADVEPLLSLWAVARTSHAVTPDTAESILRVIERSAVFVVDGGSGELAGAVIAGWDGWRGTLYRLAVRPSARRAGLASSLVAAAESWLISQGAGRLSVLVGFEDVDARGFWAAVGYEADAVIGRMVRDLDSDA